MHTIYIIGWLGLMAQDNMLRQTIGGTKHWIIYKIDNRIKLLYKG